MNIERTGEARQVKTPEHIPNAMLSLGSEYHGISLYQRQSIPETFQEVSEELTQDNAQRVAIYLGNVEGDTTWVDAALWRRFRNVLSLYLSGKSTAIVLEDPYRYVGSLPLFSLITFISGSGVLPPGTVRVMANDIRYLQNTVVDGKAMQSHLMEQLWDEDPRLATFYPELAQIILDAARVGGLVLFR